MDFPILINWTSSFPILGSSGGIFHFYSNCNGTLCKQTLETLINSAAFDLDLHWLPMSHKKDARLIWVKQKANANKKKFHLKTARLAHKDGLLLNSGNKLIFHNKTSWNGIIKIKDYIFIMQMRTFFHYYICKSSHMLRSSAYLLCKCNSVQYWLFREDYIFFIKWASTWDFST